MRIAYDPKLLEEVVFGEARGNSSLMDEYRRAVEPLYEQSGEREAGYARVHLDLFEKWGFGDRLGDALREFPVLEEKLEKDRLAPVRFAPDKSEAIHIDPVNLAFVKSVPLKSA